MTYEKIFSNIDIDRQAKNVLEIEYEQNKGREASSGADDTSVLQEDGGQQGIVPFLQRVATIRFARLERCKFGENKPTCKKCPIHCYRPQMKGQMCKVMRWAGPRMILYHPVAAIKHIIREL